MVGEAELKTYSEDGYCLVRNLIPRDVVDAVRQRVLEGIDDPPEWMAASHVVDPSVARHPKGHPYPCGPQRPSMHEAVFGEMANHANLKAAMGEVLGDDVRLFTDQIGIKHGFFSEHEQGGCSFYHQDSWYWRIDPALGCNAWIPLQPVGREAIALAIKPGTQKGWELVPHEQYFDEPKLGVQVGETFNAYKRHRIPLDHIDFSDEILFEMEPGDGLFFTNYTWHRSEPNRSGETKMFYAIAYQLTDEAIARQG